MSFGLWSLKRTIRGSGSEIFLFGNQSSDSDALYDELNDMDEEGLLGPDHHARINRFAAQPMANDSGKRGSKRPYHGISPTLRPDEDSSMSFDTSFLDDLPTPAGPFNQTDIDTPLNAAALICECGSVSVVSALVRLTQSNLLPCGSDHHVGDLESTLAGIYCLLSRAEYTPTDLSPELILSALWILDSWNDVEASRLVDVMCFYVDLHPLKPQAFTSLCPMMAQLQGEILKRSGWRVWLDEETDLRPALEELQRQPGFTSLTKHIYKESYICHRGCPVVGVSLPSPLLSSPGLNLVTRDFDFELLDTLCSRTSPGKKRTKYTKHEEHGIKRNIDLPLRKLSFGTSGGTSYAGTRAGSSRAGAGVFVPQNGGGPLPPLGSDEGRAAGGSGLGLSKLSLRDLSNLSTYEMKHSEMACVYIV